MISCINVAHSVDQKTLGIRMKLGENARDKYLTTATTSETANEIFTVLLLFDAIRLCHLGS